MAAAAVIGVVLVALLSVFYVNWRLDRSSGCHFPAIYNFGDSNSDTGSVSAVLRRVPFPNGQNFGKPSGRYSDGRLIIDFIGNMLVGSFIVALINPLNSVPTGIIHQYKVLF